MDVINTHNYDWEKPAGSKKLLSRILGEGLIGVEGNDHKMMRKAVAPAFSGRQIRDLVPVFWSKGVDFAYAMSREAQKNADGSVEIMKQMSRVTLDIIGAAGVGMDFNTINSDENKLANLYEELTGTKRGNIVVFALIMIFIPQAVVRKMYGTVHARVANATVELKAKVRALIAEKKQNLKQNSAGHKDIIGTLMRLGDFSDTYLCDQLLTFLAAGHDTTASSLTWTMWFLALKPDIQDRLRKECQEHLSDIPIEKVTADIFDEMPYLTAVCNEGLRIYPIVPFTARAAVADTKIGNTHISKGALAVIPMWVINRDKGLWGEDAEEFNPDRWLEGSSTATSTGGAKSPYAFLTFLYGPRSCIGQNFARMEMKCILAALLLRFKFVPMEPNQKVEIGGFLTIKPKDGLVLRLEDLTVKERGFGEKQ